MELKELTEKVTGLLDVQNTEELPEKIFKAVKMTILMRMRSFAI